jgi:hypothetical protein
MKFTFFFQKKLKNIHTKEWTQRKVLRAIRKSFGRSGGSDRHKTRQQMPRKFGLVVASTYSDPMRITVFQHPPPPHLLTIYGSPQSARKPLLRSVMSTSCVKIPPHFSGFFMCKLKFYLPTTRSILGSESIVRIILNFDTRVR